MNTPNHMFSYVSPEYRLPADHPLRTIPALTDEALRSSWRRFADVYAKTGCPAIPPEPLLRARRTGYSTPAYWEKVGRATWDDLLGMEDPQGPLGMDAHSTSKGCTDRVPLSLAQDISSSLRLLQVDGLTLSLFKSGEDFGDPKLLRNTPTTPVRHYGFQRSYQHSE